MRKVLLIPGLILLLDFASLYAQESGQIVLYLERTPNPAYSSVLSFDRVLLQSDFDSLLLHPLISDLSSNELARGQILLIEAEIPPGNYSQLGFSLSAQALRTAGADSLPLTYHQEVGVPLDLNVRPGAAEAVFLRWEQTASADTAQPLSSAFSLVRKKLPPLTARAYVSNEGSGNLSILDLQAGQVVGCLRVGQSPRGLAISHQRGILFVANAAANTISVLDVQTHQPRGEIALDFGDEPQALCLSADERRLFCANHGSNSVTVIDALRWTILTRIPVGSAPLDIAADPAGGWIYVVNSLSDDISVLNPQTLELANTLPAGSFPTSIDFDEFQKTAFVANSRSGYLTQIRTQQIAVSGQLNISHGIGDLVGDPSSGALYCIFEGLNYVSIFKPSLNIELAQIPVGDGPRRAAFDPQRRLLYVCCSKSDNVYVINKVSGHVERIIAAGRNPYMIVFP